MLITNDLKQRLTHFLHESFEDAKLVPAQEMNRVLDTILSRAVGYGFDNEADLATYVITAYVLGEDFDTEVPEAAQILTNGGYNSNQKAAFMESFTKQVMYALENNPDLANQVVAQQQGMRQPTAEASMSDYLSMEEQATPYREVAEQLIEALVNGNLPAVLDRFSPNFLNHLGMEQVQHVFQTQMLPFFAGAQGLGSSATTTYTHDAFGSQGFAFYLTLLHPDGEKPFIMYMVHEGEQIVLANLLPNRTYADMH